MMLTITKAYHFCYEWPYICASRLSISTIFPFDFGTVSTVWYFLVCPIIAMGFMKICDYEIHCLNVNAFVLYVLHGLLYTIHHKCTYMNNTVW